MATTTTTMIKPCDICGDHGVIEAIITCCECKVAREHLYCMRVVRTQALPFWRCEECEQNKVVSPKTTNNEQKTKTVSSLMQQTALAVEGPSSNLTAHKFNFKEKTVDKGRTKYLTCDEAVKLSSGSIKPNNTRKEFKMSKSMSPPRVFQQPSGLKEMSTPPIKSSAACERTNIKAPQEERNFKPNSQQLVSQQSFVGKGKPVPPFKNRGNDTQPIKFSMPSKRVEKTNPEREMKTSKNELLRHKREADICRHIEVPQILKKHEKPETISVCESYADLAVGRSDAGKLNLTSGLSVSEMHDPYIPTLNSYWSGCFFLPREPQKFNDSFKAHLPSRVRYKVYETTKKMPENIYFELVSSNEIRKEILPADRDDIGLYFFPMFERCESDLSTIDFIWRNNLVMKSNVEGLELFVLSSRVLPSHAQEYKGNYFLWGFFRSPKTAKKVADTRPLMVAKREAREACVDNDDVPPGFKKICKQ